MTWSLPDGSRISGFHSEDSFWEKPAGRTQDTRPDPARSPPPRISTAAAHIALPGTWTGSPGRWCCWRCRCILRRLCTGCSSGSGTTSGRGYAPPCAHPESAGRKERATCSIQVLQTCWFGSPKPRIAMSHTAGLGSSKAGSHGPCGAVSEDLSQEVPLTITNGINSSQAFKPH
uniref:Uncharacterized protein n=1 Tax=Ursus americanus TaxID=9643 RepID=A0A452SB09_URSAM